MSKPNSTLAGERTYLGERKYICCLDTNGRELTKPMSWADAEAWVMSPLTKKAYPEGVYIAPADYPKS